MDKLKEILIAYPKASALIPVVLLLVAYAYLTSITQVLTALGMSAVVIGIVTAVALIRNGKDFDDDDWWFPGGPSPV